MNSKLIFLCTFAILAVNSFATTWHIKQDGTGDFTTIQQGIDASTHTDTVLVYPGTYFENLDFNGKNIMLCSQELTSGNSQYVATTIIDGQQQESCIRIHNGETNTRIRGFTIQNGFGTQFWSRDGGGILVHDYSTVSIINCTITNNFAILGGGLLARNGSINISGVKLYENFSVLGGAIFLEDNSTLNCNESNLCVIYNNYAGRGSDIFIQDTGHINVIVDTFTVFEPSRFFAEYRDGSSLTIEIQNNWMDLVSNDLYVSTTGDDNNSGLTINDPLKTIAWAVHKIYADEDNPHTIHISEGLYSFQDNQQIFPIGCKEYVSIVGENMESTILFNDFQSNNISGINVFGTVKISNLTLNNSTDLIDSAIMRFYEVDKLIMSSIKIQNNTNNRFIIVNEHVYSEFDNLIINNNTSYGTNSGLGLHNNAGYIKNSIISNNVNLQQSSSTEVAIQLKANDDFTIENCVFNGNYADNSTGRIIRTTRHDGSGPPTTPTIRFINCLISDNSIGSNYVCQNFNRDGLTEFNNCTITNNTASGGFYSSALYNKGNVNIQNTIMHNNTDYEIFMADDTINGYNHELNVDYSNIRNGEYGIYNMNNVNIINWNEGNISNDPQFQLYGDDPYQLSDLSPCIDTGTPDTTGLFLPPWDLLNNQRIWDGDGNGIATIDMGCYEFGAPPVVSVEYPVVIHNDEINLCNYPNPFNPDTTIKFNLSESGKIKLEIYNIKGQKVKTLMDCTTAPGNYNCVWNGKNDAGKSVSSGEYFARLKVTGEEIAVRKMLLLK